LRDIDRTRLIATWIFGTCFEWGQKAKFRSDQRVHRWLGAEATASVGLEPLHFQLTENEPAASLLWTQKPTIAPRRDLGKMLKHIPRMCQLFGEARRFVRILAIALKGV
jgi:hypothetical protein